MFARLPNKHPAINAREAMTQQMAFLCFRLRRRGSIPPKLAKPSALHLAHLRARRLAYIAFIAIALTRAIDCRANTISAALSSFEATAHAWESSASEQEATGGERFSTRGDPPDLISRTVLAFVAHDRLDMTETVSESFDPRGTKLTRHLWDGQTYYTYLERASASRYELYISSLKATPDENRKNAEHDRIVVMPNSPLLGVFPGDTVCFTQILNALPASSVSCHDDVVNDVPCLLIRAIGPSGFYRVWLSPNQGFCVIKATVLRTRGDTFYGGNIGDPIPAPLASIYRSMRFPSTARTELLFELDNVKLEQISGVWITRQAEFTQTEKFEGGDSIVGHWTYRLKSVSFSPDFASLKAFLPSFRDGAEVEIYGQPRGVIPLRWHGGRVEPAVDETERAKLDQEVQDALKQADEGSK